MSKIQIYLHAENNRVPGQIEIDERSQVQEIIQQYRRSAALSPGDEINIFLEDEEEIKEKNQPAQNAGIKKKSKIHCHRCRKITTTVFFNGEDKDFEFPPSTTAKKALKTVLKKFNIDETDAIDYQLKLEDGTALQPADHIGSFASFPGCKLKLFLTALKPVQG